MSHQKGTLLSVTTSESPDEQSPLLDLTFDIHYKPSSVLPPRVNAVRKFLEVLCMFATRLRVLCCESKHHSSMSASFEPLSEIGRFVKLYVEPMFHWWGANFRLLTTPCLGTVDVVNAAGERRSVVNGASHNYAGFYAPTAESEELQRFCLDNLPVSDSDAVPLLRDSVHATIAGFFSSDFCFTTSTGYGANYVALPALIDSTRTVVFMDRACHNSIFTGVFLGRCSNVHKFRHNDMIDLEAMLQRLPRNSDREIIVVVEGLYSMDGDIPPLSDLWRLKSDYRFTLYCDEAHSFLSIGSTGLGCLQYWNENHPKYPVPWDLFDTRTGTLSKAIGGIGGFIAGKSAFKERIRRHIDKIQDRDHISVPTSTMVQTLLVMGQPRRISRNLRRLAQISRFCRAELDRLGIYVYVDETGTPILPVWAGRPSASARLSFALRQAGLLASPVTTPAVPFWESRVRVNLSADYGEADVEKLINSIVSAVDSVGLCRRSHGQFWVNRFKGLPTAELEECDESGTSFAKVKALVGQASVHWQDVRYLEATPQYASPDIGASSVDSGHSARSMYGIGAGSARWISGTFPVHLAAEQLLAHTHGVEAAMTYADATIGLASTVAALARPVLGRKRHYMLYPHTATGAVREGLTLIPPGRKDGTDQKVLQYRGQQHLLETTGQLAQRDDACFTVIVHARAVNVLKGLARMARKCPITILLHNPSRFLNVQQMFADGAVPNAVNVQILIYGSLYEILDGLPGGYLVGSEALVRELRYTSRGYMYTTSTPPFIMAMIQEALKAASKTA